MSNSLEAKIVVLGSQGVGKTSLVNRFVKNAFTPPNMMTSTIGASFLTKRVVDIDTSSVVRLQIWDTAGQERFRSISKLYYRGANAALLCYDITSPQSFEEMGHWLVELRSNLPEDTVLHIVGTKADLVAEDPSRRKVPFERCIAYIAENLNPAGAPPTQYSARPDTAPGDYFSHASTDRHSGKPSHSRNKSASNILTTASAAAPHSTPFPLASPLSNRSSLGFWSQDIGWDCCHEVSSSSGEGVEEVFRVITRRLVEQRNGRAALEARLMEQMGGMTPGLGGDERGGFFGEHGAGGEAFGPGSGNGSFRVGYGDKRRSWLGLPQFPGGGVGEQDAAVEGEGVPRRRKGCC